MKYGKSSFIVTVHVISIRVHFSALIIDTLATFGSVTPTKLDGHSNNQVGF